MAGYQYKGNDFSIPPERTYTIGGKRHASGCGTRSGYVAHRKAKETPCDPCREANSAYSKAYDARRKARLINKGWNADKCGTLAGYKAHYWYARPACEPCRKANSEYCKAFRASRKATA